MDVMENRGDNLSVGDIIETLNLLITPSSSQNKCEELVADPLLHPLQCNLERLDKHLSDKQLIFLKERIVKTDVPDSSLKWQYLNHILQLLHLLCQAVLKLQADEASGIPCSEDAAGKDSKPKRPQDAPPLRKAALSVGTLSTVKTALQLLTTLGICPNLAPGVGIPVQYRSKVVSLVPLDMASDTEHSSARLGVCMSILVEMIQIPEIESIILSEPHLADILAAVLQLRKGKVFSQISCQRKKADSEVPPQEIPDESKKTPPQQTQDTARCKPCAMSSDRCADGSVSSTGDKGDCERDVCASSAGDDDANAVNCQKIVQCVIALVDPVLLMRTLMVLQNGIPEKFQKQRNPGSPVVLPPVWLKNLCSQMLFMLTEQPQGILHVFEAISSSVVDIQYMFSAPDPSPSATWRHCGVVANIVSGRYRDMGSPEDRDNYLASVSHQLMDLLHVKKGKEGDKLTKLVGRVAAATTLKCDGFLPFHNRLLRPLHSCSGDLGDRRNGTVVVSEGDLTKCLQCSYQVYIKGQQSLCDILSALTPVIEVLWALFCVTQSGVYSIKHWVKELLVSYLKFLGRKKAATFLECQDERSRAVRFKAGKEGGVQVVHCDSASLGEERHVSALISVLQELKTEGVPGELLVILLKGMTDIISKETQHKDIVLPVRLHNEEKKQELKRWTTLLHQIASICETFGAECLTDNTHILLFVKASLERGVMVCGGTTEEETVAFETSTMSMTLALLTAVMASAIEMKEEDRQLMDSLLPLLEVIGQGHSDEFIREMAADIRIAIATRGAVWSSVQQSKKEENKSKPRKREGADLQEPKKNSAVLTGEKESSLPLTELSLKREESPMKTSSSKPLIEVLSEHTFSDSEEAEEKSPSSLKQTDPESLLGKTAREVSEMSLEKDEKSASKVSEMSLGTDEKSASKVSEMSLEKDEKSVSKVSEMLLGTDEKSLLSSQTSSPSGEQAVMREGSTPENNTENSDLHTKSTQQGSAFKKSFHREKEPDESERSPLQTVFQELCDPLLPVRGHALIALARLVQEKDSETLSKRQVVQKVFEENLRHGDSYLYLAAINGLSALSDSFPESVLPFLASEFAAFQKLPLTQTAENRLKVGEALMKATRNLGEMIPKYRDLLLGAILTGAHDKDVTVRASSVSNLAEVCSLLRFSIGPVLHEIVSCCTNSVQADEPVVRQAAAMTLCKLIDGLGKDIFTVLEFVCTELYRLLKKVCALDPDDTVRLHANLALDRLDGIMREYLFPKQTLQKRIQVLPDANTFR
ncbi:hypothetical protein ACOMHN_034530 [Nucella lapillus]